MPKPIAMYGAEFGWGAQRPETQWGPQIVQSSDLIQKILKHRNKVQWKSFLPALSYSAGKKLSYTECLNQVTLFNQKLAHAIAAGQQEEHFPLVIGGDHSIAIGSWSGLIHALDAPSQFGLIWIDAHMDSHTIQTTPSHAIHGMPLAVLMGHGEERLVNIARPGPKLDPKHVVLIGVRSFEEGEKALLEQLNVKVYYIQEVKTRGFAEVFQEAVTHATKDTKGFGLSIDLDGFDPSEAPGVGSPVLGGLFKKDVLPALASMDRQHFKALEIAEFNPSLDKDAKTLSLIKDIVLSLI